MRVSKATSAAPSIFFEGDKINAPALKKLVRAAIEFNQAKKKKKMPVKKAATAKKAKSKKT